MMTLVSPVFMAAVLLAVMGLINLHSATQGFLETGFSSYVTAQTVYHVCGLVLALLLARVRSRRWQNLAFGIYGASLLLLVLVLVLGQTINGSQSWLSLGPINIQPSEFAKIGLVLALSSHLSRRASGALSVSDLFGPALITAAPMVLVLWQGDLGTSLFFMLIVGTLVLAKGVRWNILVMGLVLVVVGGVVAHQFFLKPYQKKRIVSFMDPELDPRGSGYHLVQSKIAVGSGGFLGNGYRHGKSHKLKFLPERHTDFVFSVLAEEWGFFGCALVLVLYGSLMLAGVHVASRAGTPFVALCALGLSSLFFWHLFTNLGGVLGLIPLTGVPLVFLSYGGSAVMMAWCTVGILLSLRNERGKFF